METQYCTRRSLRLLHPGVRAVVGLAAAAAALASALLVFGPLADQKTLALTGMAPPRPPSGGPAAPQVRVASLRPGMQTK